MDNVITQKQLITLALIGLLILVLFAVGFVWLYYYGVDVFLAFAPFCIFPYLVGISVYVGFFAARFPGPAIFAFLAPVLSALLFVLLLSIRRKATV